MSQAFISNKKTSNSRLLSRNPSTKWLLRNDEYRSYICAGPVVGLYQIIIVVLSDNIMGTQSLVLTTYTGSIFSNARKSGKRRGQLSPIKIFAIKQIKDRYGSLLSVDFKTSVISFSFHVTITSQSQNRSHVFLLKRTNFLICYRKA